MKNLPLIIINFAISSITCVLLGHTDYYQIMASFAGLQSITILLELGDK